MRLVQHIACDGGMTLLQQQRQKAVDRVNVNSVYFDVCVQLYFIVITFYKTSLQVFA
jgi:hypothetical protein